MLDWTLYETGENGVQSGQCVQKAYVGPYQTFMM